MTFTEAQTKALNIEESMCVTASAGTGKTTLLAERYLVCLAEGNVLPKNILCLTYTEKAAVEMRDKIEANLRRKYEETQDPHLHEALETFYLSQISTFHGFCAAILREFPLEAGITPGFSIMDELARDELLDKTIDTFLQNPPKEFYGKLTFLFTRFKKRTVSKKIRTIVLKWRTLEEWYAKFCRDPEALYQELVEHCRRNVETTTDEVLRNKGIAAFLEACEAENYPDSSKVGKILAAYRNLKDAKTPEAKAACLENLSRHKDLTKKTMVSFNHCDFSPAGREYFVSCMKQINAVPVKLPPFDSPEMELLRKATGIFCSVAQELYQRIERKKKHLGVMDFDDLICAARGLMKNTGVVDQLKKRFRFVLVDEVQDNDPALTEIIDALRFAEGEDNRLFIVGDLKQSIYKFRGADPEGAREYFNTFEHSVELDTCFRSLPPVIDAVDAVFPLLFTGEKPGLAYSGITCHRKGTHGSVQVIRSDPLAEDGVTVEDELKIFEEESKRIAGWIQDAVDTKSVIVEVNGILRPATYGDIVILEDRGTDLPFLTEQLNSYGIPFRVVKGKEFYASAEVADFLLLMRALAYREDDIALFGALTSPYFGITPELLAGCGEGYGPLITRIEKSPRPELKTALEQLEALRNLAATTPLSTLAHHIVRTTGILSVYASTKDGAEKISNLTALVDGISENPETTIFTFIERLQKNIEAEAKDVEKDEDISEEDANVVRIMTIHAAKGLQFPVVILAFAGREALNIKAEITADRDIGLGFSIENEDGKGVPSYVHQVLLKELKTATREERERLFYVAMTRAQDHLILAESASCGIIKNTSFMAYYRNAVSEEEDTLITEVRGEIKDTSYDLYQPQNWIASGPEQPEETDAEPDAPREVLEKGDCIHKIFEGEDPKETCIHYGFSELEQEFTEKYEHFLASPLMQDVIESYCEFPVTNKAGENRRIDRLVQKKDGSFVIIDYKSGTSENKSKELCEMYKDQLTEYAEIMSELLGMPVPAWLYFIGDGTAVKIC